MKIGPKYKIARRLGGSVFDKTQTQKFAMRAAARKEKERAGKKKKRKNSSDFCLQLIEKQKARFTYGMSEKQFKNTIEDVLKKRSANISESLIQSLELRLDNVIYRLGLANSRQATRQMVNHGHIDVNGKRVDIPSYKVSVGEVITIREKSKSKPIFKDLDQKLKEVKVPSWLALDIEKKVAKVQGLPKIPANELAFDVSAIFQYYSR